MKVKCGKKSDDLSLYGAETKKKLLRDMTEFQKLAAKTAQTLGENAKKNKRVSTFSSFICKLVFIFFSILPNVEFDGDLVQNGFFVLNPSKSVKFFCGI